MISTEAVRGEWVAAHWSHGPLGLAAAHQGGNLLRANDPAGGASCGARAAAAPAGGTLNDLERIVDTGEPVADHRRNSEP